MSSMTLAQIAVKPITVANEEAISSFADSRQGRLATLLRRPDGIHSLPGSECALSSCRPLKWRQQSVNELTLGCRNAANASRTR
jgi:hypothetical protein